jgi:error-prone DNA polymerase
VLGVDVNASDALATLEGFASPADDQPGPSAGPAIRPGLSGVRNLGTQAAERVAAGRPYRDLEDFAARTALPGAVLEALALAGAFGCFGLSRRAALWAAGAAATVREGQLAGTTPGLDPEGPGSAPPLPAMTPAEETLADLWATGTYGTHPLAHIRDWLAERQVLPAASLRSAAADSYVTVAGLVTHKQQPPTARGVVFLSLEDETGMVNVICPPQVWARHRRIAAAAPALLIQGRVERAGGAERTGSPQRAGGPERAGGVERTGGHERTGGPQPAGSPEPTGGAVNLVAAVLRPLRPLPSTGATVPSRDFR